MEHWARWSYGTYQPRSVRSLYWRGVGRSFSHRLKAGAVQAHRAILVGLRRVFQKLLLWYL
jgi:hypothetical protein